MRGPRSPMYHRGAPCPARRRVAAAERHALQQHAPPRIFGWWLRLGGRHRHRHDQRPVACAIEAEGDLVELDALHLDDLPEEGQESEVHREALGREHRHGAGGTLAGAKHRWRGVGGGRCVARRWRSGFVREDAQPVQGEPARQEREVDVVDLDAADQRLVGLTHDHTTDDGGQGDAHHDPEEQEGEQHAIAAPRRKAAPTGQRTGGNRFRHDPRPYHPAAAKSQRGAAKPFQCSWVAREGVSARSRRSRSVGVVRRLPLVGAVAQRAEELGHLRMAHRAAGLVGEQILLGDVR